MEKGSLLFSKLHDPTPDLLRRQTGLSSRRENWLRRIPTKCEIELNNLQKPQDVEDVLFDLLREKADYVSFNKFWSAIKSVGLRPNDPRLNECHSQFEKILTDQAVIEEEDVLVDRDTFKSCVAGNIFLIGRAFKKDLVIPEFDDFSEQIKDIYIKCLENRHGFLPSIIPQLARVNLDGWGVAICTIDGQRTAVGDVAQPFSLQACCMPINYALALSELGKDKVHQYIGFEPSGGRYDEISLNHNSKPHNPVVNAGALVTVSLLKNKLAMADRFDHIFNQYKRLAGHDFIGYNNSIYLSAKSTSDRNFSIAYYLRENKCFPSNVNLQETLEMYFQLHAIEITPETGSVIAATLANGGICPTTGERVLNADAVRNTLSLMHSCGMNSYSGQFAFKVGLPAKSGVSGAVLLVVPRVMGVCLWSPRLNEDMNSSRGVEFCEEFVKIFAFHNMDLHDMDSSMTDPRKRRFEKEAQSVINFLFGAANGDVSAVRRFALSGLNMDAQDYDGRTALHVAAAEGHLNVVKDLIEHCNVEPAPEDRWGNTPLDDARRFGHLDIMAYLAPLTITESDEDEGIQISGEGGRTMIEDLSSDTDISSESHDAMVYGGAAPGVHVGNYEVEEDNQGASKELEKEIRSEKDD